MAKRRAAEQIAKGFARDDDSSSDEERDDGTSAPADVLANRKIAVPRSRLKKTVGTGSAFAGLKSNPFGELSQGNAGSSSSTTAIPFSFLGQKKSEDKPQTSSIISSNSSKESTTTHSTTQLKMRGLNSSFASQISKANTESPFENWSEMCNKYLNYVKKITQEQSNTPEPSSATTVGGLFSLSSQAPATDGTSKSTEAKPQITSTGFSFGKPLSDAKTFQFGDKTVENKKAHSSKPSGGFVFNPNGKGEIKPAPSNSAADTSDMKDDEGSANSSANSNDDNTNNKSLGESQSTKEMKPAFTFGNTASNSTGLDSSSSTAQEQKPAATSFVFGSNAASAPKSDTPKSDNKPLFNFMTADKSQDQGKEAQKFSFGIASSSSASQPDASSKAFSFGSATMPSKDEPKPKFAFGSAPTTDTKKQETSTLSFGSNDSKPAFSFGMAAKPDSTGSEEKKPAFNFGTSTNSNSNSSGSGSEEKKPVFSFGNSAGSSSTSSDVKKPTFSFGTPANPEEKKPTFSFGKTPSADSEKPKFQFGASNKTEFAFGTGVNPFSAKSDKSAAETNNGSKVDTAWKQDHPIKIASVDDVSKNGAAPASSSAEGGEPSEEQNDPQTDLGGPGPGEENENCVYEKKSKAFELVDGEYKPLGLGFLRVLVHKETKKARALIRAEGSGRVLLNIPIRKEFNYTVVGKGQVKLLDVKPGNDSPTVYLVRVKTEEDGNDLKDKLQEIKN